MRSILHAVVATILATISEMDIACRPLNCWQAQGDERVPADSFLLTSSQSLEEYWHGQA